MGDASSEVAAAVPAPANAIPPALIAKLVLGGAVVIAAVVAGYFLMQTPAPVPAPAAPKFSPPTPLPSFPLPSPAPGQPVQALSTPFKDLCHVCKDSWCQWHRNKQPSRHTQQQRCNRCPSPRRPLYLQHPRPLHLWRPRPHWCLLHLWHPRPLPHRPQPPHGPKPSMLLMTDVGSTPKTIASWVTLTRITASGRYASTWRPRQDGTCVANKREHNVGSRRVTP